MILTARIFFAYWRLFTFFFPRFLLILFFFFLILQNDRITKLKIDNNPFAKGFRESGQSRCKRKLAQSSQTSINHNIISSSSSNSTTTETKSIDDDVDECDTERKRQRTNSFNGSVSSLDDSGLSFSETSSGKSTPVTSTSDIRVCDEDDNRIAGVMYKPPDVHHPLYHQHNVAHQELVLQQFRDSLQQPWMDLAFSYLNRAAVPYLPFYQPQPFFNPTSPYAEHIIMHEQYAAEVPVKQNKLHHVEENTIKPPKKCGFTISAILGCES